MKPLLTARFCWTRLKLRFYIWLLRRFDSKRWHWVDYGCRMTMLIELWRAWGWRLVTIYICPWFWGFLFRLKQYSTGVGHFRHLTRCFFHLDSRRLRWNRDSRGTWLYLLWWWLHLPFLALLNLLKGLSQGRITANHHHRTAVNNHSLIQKPLYSQVGLALKNL